MTEAKSAGPQVKSVNFRNAGLYIYGQFGSKMAVDCTGPAFPGPIKWSALKPKNHRPCPDAHLPSTELGVAPNGPVQVQSGEGRRILALRTVAGDCPT